MNPALLTKSELEWLQGNKQVSKSYSRYMKSTIRKKVEAFAENELPLIASKGLLEGLERAKCLTGLHHRSPSFTEGDGHRKILGEPNWRPLYGCNKAC
jgi:hypothetical protein